MEKILIIITEIWNVSVSLFSHKYYTAPKCFVNMDNIFRIVVTLEIEGGKSRTEHI